EEGALLLAGHDVDALPAAHLLAQLATDAGLLVDLDLAQVLRPVLVRGVDAVEGADVDAHPAAVAVVGMDDRDRPLLALEHLGHVAPGVENGLVGADDPACAAVDAEPGLDQKGLLELARDGTRGAALLARGAAGAAPEPKAGRDAQVVTGERFDVRAGHRPALLRHLLRAGGDLLRGADRAPRLHRPLPPPGRTPGHLHARQQLARDRVDHRAR